MNTGDLVIVNGGTHFLRHGVIEDWPTNLMRPQGWHLVRFLGVSGKPLRKQGSDGPPVDALNGVRLNLWATAEDAAYARR